MMGHVVLKARHTMFEEGEQRRPDEANALRPILAGPAFNRGCNPS